MNGGLALRSGRGWGLWPQSVERRRVMMRLSSAQSKSLFFPSRAKAGAGEEGDEDEGGAFERGE